MHDARTWYDRWADGEIDTQTAIAGVAQEITDLREEFAPARDQVAAYEAQEQRLKEDAEQIVRGAHQRVMQSHGLVFRYVQPEPKTEYDAKAVDALIIKLIQNGYAEIADALAACRRTTARTPHLRIERDRR